MLVFCVCLWCSFVHRPREIVASSGGVTLDGVGAVVRSVLGDIDLAVVVVLDVVVAMPLDGAISFKICVEALTSFAAVGFRLCGVLAPSAVCIRGGTLLGCEWQRRGRVLHPIARETRMREQVYHHTSPKPRWATYPLHQPHLALVSAPSSLP